MTKTKRLIFWTVTSLFGLVAIIGLLYLLAHTNHQVENSKAQQPKKEQVAVAKIHSVVKTQQVAKVQQINNHTGGKEFLNQHIRIQVQTFPNEGSNQVEGQVDYKSYPPTSGNYNPVPAQYGYQENVSFENLVHNLKKGDIVIYFQPSLYASDLQALMDLSKIRYKSSGVVLVPLDSINKPVIVTAWTKEMELDNVDVPKIKQFMYQYLFESLERSPAQQM